MKYKHPSFRESVIEYFEENDMSSITSIAFRLLEMADTRFIRLKPLHPIIFKMTREMEISKLVQLVMDSDISIEVNTMLFSNLLYSDPAIAVETFLKMETKRHPLKSPVNYTPRHSMEQALGIITDGLKSGKINYSKRLNRLVTLLLKASIYKTLELYNALNTNNKSELRFKVTLLTPIAHKIPATALREIRSLLWNDIPGNIRMLLYGVLSDIRVPIALNMAMDLLMVEENPFGIKRLERALHNLNKLHSPKAGLHPATIEFMIIDMHYGFYEVCKRFINMSYDSDITEEAVRRVIEDLHPLLIYPGFYMKYADQAWKIRSNYDRERSKANSVEGELIMAIEALRKEAHENKNVNWDQNFEQYCTLLWNNLNNTSIFESKVLDEIRSDIDTLLNYQLPYLKHDLYDRVSDRIIEWSSTGIGPISLRDRVEIKN